MRLNIFIFNRLNAFSVIESVSAEAGKWRFVRKIGATSTLFDFS